MGGLLKLDKKSSPKVYRPLPKCEFWDPISGPLEILDAIVHAPTRGQRGQHFRIHINKCVSFFVALRKMSLANDLLYQGNIRHVFGFHVFFFRLYVVDLSLLLYFVKLFYVCKNMNLSKLKIQFGIYFF